MPSTRQGIVQPTMTSACWLVTNLGPYHHARFSALNRRSEIDLEVLELAPQDTRYPWTRPVSASYRWRTLFPDKRVEALGSLVASLRLSRALRRSDATVYVANGYSRVYDLAAVASAKSSGRLVVSVFDSTRADRMRYAPIEVAKGATLQHLFDGFFCSGERSENYLRGLGVDPERIQRGYDVVDNAHYSGSGAGLEKKAGLKIPDTKYFLAVSRLSPEKNLAGLLDAYETYCHRSVGCLGCVWPLVICGSGPLERELRARCARLAAGQAVFLGFVGYADMPEMYQRSGCLVLSSTSEPWGLVVNEAMAAGTPVLVSNRCGCAPDLVREGENGFTFEPSDTEGLAALMLKVAELAEEARREMGRRGQEIISRYTPQTWADNFIELVQRCEEMRKLRRRR